MRRFLEQQRTPPAEWVGEQHAARVHEKNVLKRRAVEEQFDERRGRTRRSLTRGAGAASVAPVSKQRRVLREASRAVQARVQLVPPCVLMRLGPYGKEVIRDSA